MLLDRVDAPLAQYVVPAGSDTGNPEYFGKEL